MPSIPKSRTETELRRRSHRWSNRCSARRDSASRPVRPSSRGGPSSRNDQHSSSPSRCTNGRPGTGYFPRVHRYWSKWPWIRPLLWPVKKKEGKKKGKGGLMIECCCRFSVLKRVEKRAPCALFPISFSTWFSTFTRRSVVCLCFFDQFPWARTLFLLLYPSCPGQNKRETMITNECWPVFSLETPKNMAGTIFPPRVLPGWWLVSTSLHFALHWNFPSCGCILRAWGDDC